MSTAVRLFIWLWRAWPIFALLGILLVHLAFIHIFSWNAAGTNKTIALISQLTGGLLVLYSINSNIGIIKGQSVFGMFINYLREFPLIHRTIVLEAQGIASLARVGKPSLTVSRNPKTLEEQLDYLQQQISDVRRDLIQEAAELNQKIDDYSREQKSRLGEVQASLKTVESKIDEVSVGGISIQLFGILLLTYGSVADYLA